MSVVSRDKPIPLSMGQERMWFVQELTPHVAINIPVIVHMTGALDIDLFERSLNQVIERHEALRTSVADHEGVLTQAIAPDLKVTLCHIDLQDRPEAEREAEAHRIAHKEIARPFQLDAGPLFRLLLIRLAPDRFVFVMPIHHLIMDGWSFLILLRELFTFYTAALQGRSPELPPNRVQYADYSMWERNYLSGAVLDEKLSFWEQQLRGKPFVLELPCERTGARQAGAEGRTLPFDVPDEVAAAVQALSRQHKVTPFMVLLAAFKTLLYRYTGQEEVIVGSPVANRNVPEFRDLVGLFMNPVPLASSVAGAPTFLEQVQREKQVILAGFQHGEVPIDGLVERLKPARHHGRMPIYQHLFIYQNFPNQSQELPGLELAFEYPHLPSTLGFDLAIQMWQEGPSLKGTWQYRVDLFDEAAMQQMLRHFRTLLADAVARPETPLSELRLFADDERAQLLRDWAAGAARPIPSTSVDRLFEARVDEAPEAVAASFPGLGVKLTYDELDRRANQLAHYLKQQGVGPESRVGVCLDRSPEMLVALLAIMKSGGAYVPLDPAYPTSRLRYVVEDAGLGHLLTRAGYSDRFVDDPGGDGAATAGGGGQMLIWEVIEAEVAAASEARPDAPSDPARLAYVIYTSGSTGRPKGVQIEHRALTNFLLSMQHTPGLGPRDRLLSVTTLSFDIAGLELYLPLITGAQVVLLSQEETSDGRLIAETLEREAITVMQSTPATWKLLLDSGWSGRPGLKMLCGGEALPRALAGTLAGKGEALWNMFGPTETTIWSTVCRIEPDAPVISIGRPIDNTQIYILDKALQPVPVGVAGDLYIGGDGLARGYLNRPELTAERFIPHPFVEDPEARIYMTGDLARYLPDGRIECLGRTDHQVKVRGFRIELGEIEAVLIRHDAVRDCAVDARSDAAGTRFLVGYIVLHDEVEAPAASALRRHLQAQLPEYMVPTAFLTLDALPLTPNGKVDRKALPDPSGAALQGDGAFVAPRTPEEETVAEIFGEVLGIERVGVYDDFFTLGGHSLLATQAVSRIRDAFGVDMTLRRFFEAQTVEQLAGAIKESLIDDKGGAVTPSAALPPLKPLDTVPDKIPLSFSQERMWFLQQLLPESAAYNIAFGVRIKGPFDIEMYAACFGELIERHEALRTHFREKGGHPYQVVVDPEPARFRREDVRNLPSAEARTVQVESLALEEALRPFNLSTDLLYRLLHVQVADDECVIVHVYHHIISDQWAIILIARELMALYRARLEGRKAELAPLPIQYSDFACWQRSWLQGAVREELLAYWTTHLDGYTPFELPTDYLRPAIPTNHGAYHLRKLPARILDAVQRMGEEENITPAMIYMAAFNTLLYRYTGHSDITLGMPVANRNRSEVENLMGVFINTLAIRTDLSGHPTGRELLRRVRQVMLDGYDHQDLPFEQLVDAMHPERDLSMPPIVQVLFNVQNAQRFEPAGLPFSLKAYTFMQAGAQFDLTVNIEGDERDSLRVLYSTDLFERATIERMFDHFERVLEALLSDPDRPVASLPLMSADEKDQILLAWNHTDADYPQDRCTPDLMTEQARRTPDAMAVVGADETLTYAELEARSNQLARYLIELGVMADTMVGICMERSAAMVVGVVAILKAGGTYVPMDPNYPSRRLQHMMEETRMPVLLLNGDAEASLPEHTAMTVHMERQKDVMARYSTEPPGVRVDPEQVAYVIFTSGSTGLPKGVLVRHQGLTNLLYSIRTSPGITADDVWASVTTLSFDIATLEVCLPLIVGARLVVVSQDVTTDGRRLAELLDDVSATIMQATPATWRLLVDGGWKGRPGLRMITGGESLAAGLAEQLLDRGGSLWNLYGPTETTIYSTGGEIERDTRITIGRPIANTEAYILDENLQPVPVGVAGTLYLGGDGLARGYLNRPELTAERFIPHPFSDRPGARIYNTGDLARFLADGRIECLGRVDHQVKIRGFRIELGEIEAVLETNTSIEQAVVVARDDAMKTKRLIAYFIQRADRVADPQALRAYLREALPDYMVPSFYVRLDAMPLTPSGKVDRKALPELEEVQSDLADSYVPPEDEIEVELAKIWEEVLQVRPIGRTSNFFELGGHSLNLLIVVDRIEKSFGIQIPVRELFLASTVERAANLIRPRLEREGSALEGAWTSLIRRFRSR